MAYVVRSLTRFHAEFDWTNSTGKSRKKEQKDMKRDPLSPKGICDAKVVQIH